MKSLRSAVLDDPVIAKELAKHRATVVQAVSGPYPVASNNRIETTDPVKRTIAQVNANVQLLLNSTFGSNERQGGAPQVPHAPGPLVAQIKDRLGEIVRRLASGELKATATGLDGKPMDVAASMWEHPDAAVHLAGSDLLLLDGQQLKRIATGVMVEEVDEDRRSSQPKGDRYNVDYYLNLGRQWLQEGKFKGKLKVATEIVKAHEKQIEGSSHEAKIEYIRRRL